MTQPLTTADLIDMLHRADPTGERRIEIEGDFDGGALTFKDIQVIDVSDDLGDRIVLCDNQRLFDHLGHIGFGD